MLKVLSIVATLIALSERAGDTRGGLLMRMCRPSSHRALFAVFKFRNRLVQRTLLFLANSDLT